MWLALEMIRTNSPFIPYASQRGRSGFVRAAFTACEFRFGGHEFAAEGFGEDCLRQLIG